MNVHPQPIGVFDSGLGGLSVAGEIRKLLPGADLVYAADGRYCPYGVRPEEEIRERAVLIGAELVARGASLLVVACNTATSVALGELRKRLSVPVVGLEPAVKPAVARSRTGRIGVLTTPRTAVSERLARLIATHAGGARVSVVPAPELVGLVESGRLDGPEVEAALRRLVGHLVADGVDVMVLGCTHFPFLRQPLERIVGPGVTIVDSGEAVARRTRQLLDAPAATTPGERSFQVLTTGDRDRTAYLMARLLGRAVPVERLAV